MIRTILSSLAIAAVLSMPTQPLAASDFIRRPAQPSAAAAPQLQSNQRPVACDCTNCSAEHCPKPAPAYFVPVDRPTMTQAKKKGTPAAGAFKSRRATAKQGKKTHGYIRFIVPGGTVNPRGGIQ